MKKKLLLFSLIIYNITLLTAQNTIIKGRILEITSNEPVPDVNIQIKGSLHNTTSNTQGLFLIMSNQTLLGEQIVVISKKDYITQFIPVTIQHNDTINIDPILLQVDLNQRSDIGVISLSDDELTQDNGTSFNISNLLQASKEVFLTAAAFDFSPAFFKPRGLDNANGKVLINGIEMNKLFNGRPQWSNWGGLNSVQRNRVFSSNLKANDYTFGGTAGTTTINMRASTYREGGQVSFAASNRSYRGRVIANYNSGVSQHGWAYTIAVSRRFGEEGFIEGTVYDANSFFGSIEKKINRKHSLNLTGFFTPNRRGRSTAVTQEVNNLKGVRYNPNWGFQNGKIRNSRIREIEEPIFMLNHYWDISPKISLNTNIGYQFGTIKNSRIDNGGTRPITASNGEQFFAGGASNPLPNFFRLLPSGILEDNPTNFAGAFAAQNKFQEDGQLDWKRLIEGNFNNGIPKLATFIIQNDVIEDSQLSINTIMNTTINDHLSINGAFTFRSLLSKNYAEVADLLGAIGYLDIDSFSQVESEIAGAAQIQENLAQSDLQNPNRIALEGDKYKYNYEIDATEVSIFTQAQFKYNKVDFYIAGQAGQTIYQRTGLFENGNFPGVESLGNSDKLNFKPFGIKGGVIYKITGRHLLDINAGYLTKAPTIRNSFSNARQNNNIIIGIEEEKIKNLDVNYIYRSPIIKGRLSGFYNTSHDQTDLSFYFTQSISGLGANHANAFVQEVLTGINTRRVGLEFGLEAQATPTIKLKAATSVGQYIYTNNPNLYLTSDDFKGPLSFGDGTTKLNGLHIAGGPERVYQIGFEYRDPAFWWVGVTTNHFSNAYIDINNLARSDNFARDFDGQLFNDFDSTLARELLRQEQINSYTLVNIIGGKSWRIGPYFIGFFAAINNVLGQHFITGGFEQGRTVNFRNLRDDIALLNGRVFGPRYFFGNTATYFINSYIRF